MEKPAVYVDTTVPSAYLEERCTPEMLQRRELTRRWWSGAPEKHQMLGSALLIGELSVGTPARVRQRLALVSELRMLPLTPDVTDAADLYIRHKLMPADPIADAYHLAFASCYACEFLVSWNYRHLVNPSKFVHIRKINALRGLFVPSLVTPAQLLGGHDGNSLRPRPAAR